MNVGIVGSRRRNKLIDKIALERQLRKLIRRYGKESIVVVSGGCPLGADRFAEELVEEYGLPEPIIHRPDRSKLEADTRWAYTKMFHARNTDIARDSDILIALTRPERKGGTEDTVRKFIKMGKGKDLILVG